MIGRVPRPSSFLNLRGSVITFNWSHCSCFKRLCIQVIYEMSHQKGFKHSCQRYDVLPMPEGLYTFRWGSLKHNFVLQRRIEKAKVVQITSFVSPSLDVSNAFLVLYLTPPSVTVWHHRCGDTFLSTFVLDAYSNCSTSDSIPSRSVWGVSSRLPT
ncbi:hypothetical protein CEXT_464731 [Caerostris extrusa]|uniref:Uncharacterized protein n=1 Tax=Caerostris extrusa TaxID=172846 RepID=A0AAV4S7N3_CAEEX|nr:hypothetical protein CEXT_464731 [Caerostris extrusa]